MVRILAVDDEDAIVELVALTLRTAGYYVDIAMDGNTAADMAENNHYDLLLLDVMLPGIDGYDLLQYMAPTGVPVILLTAKTAVDDRVKGLRLGADDYISKPFNATELVARVEAVLRRAGKGDNLLAAHGVTLDTTSHEVICNGSPVRLTPKEFCLLEILMRNQGIALYRDVLFERVWGDEPEEGTRTLDLNIMRLRKKLGWGDYIRTVHRIGYMLEKG